MEISRIYRQIRLASWTAWIKTGVAVIATKVSLEETHPHALILTVLVFHTTWSCLLEPGSQVIRPSSAPRRMEVAGGTTAATQPIPTADTTWGEPIPATWPNMARTTVWCGWTGRGAGTHWRPSAWRSGPSSPPDEGAATETHTNDRR